MTDSSIKVHQTLIRLPLVHPFETSFGVQTAKFAIIIKLIDHDGNIGYGETIADEYPGYSYETKETTWLIQQKYLIPRFLALFEDNFPTIEEILNVFSQIRGHNFAKTGLEAAYWSLKASRDKTNLGKLYGAKKDQIPTGVSIGIQPNLESLLQRIGYFLNLGYQRIKIKIKPGWDKDVVGAIRKEYGDIKLMVDANSAYSLKPSHIEIFQAMDRYDLMMIEQPLAYDDMLDHMKLQKQIETPLCLDESIHSVSHARQAIEFECCKIINIKPARVGGYYNAKKIAKELGKDRVWLGGMLETGIGRLHNIFIQAREEFTIPGDTSGSDRYFAEDIIDPQVKVNESGFIQVPKGLNLGYTVRDDFIFANALQHAEF